MALAVVLLALALLATASLSLSCASCRKQLLLIAAGDALAGTRARHPLLETLTVVLLASGLRTGAFPDSGLGFGRIGASLHAGEK